MNMATDPNPADLGELVARARREWNLCQSHSDYYGPTPTEWAFSYADPILDALAAQQREIETWKVRTKAAIDECVKITRRAEALEKERDKLVLAIGDHVTVRGQYYEKMLENGARAIKAEAEVAALQVKVASPELIALGKAAERYEERPIPARYHEMAHAALAYVASIVPIPTTSGGR